MTRLLRLGVALATLVPFFIFGSPAAARHALTVEGSVGAPFLAFMGKMVLAYGPSPHHSWGHEG